MDIAELIAESEQLKKRTIETAQQLAEAKRLLSRVQANLEYFAEKYQDCTIHSLSQDVEEFLQ